jgi:hypothetical protein
MTFILSNLKNIFYGLIAFSIFGSCLWFHGYYSGIKHKENETRNSPISVTVHNDSTARTQQTITGTAKVKPISTPQNRLQPIIQQPTKNVDSLQQIVIDQAYELQAQEEELNWLREPKSIEINNDVVGHLIMTFYPTDGKADTANYLFTEPVRYDHHSDSIFTRTVLIDRPWYEVPAYLIGGMAIGVLTMEILKP